MPPKEKSASAPKVSKPKAKAAAKEDAKKAKQTKAATKGKHPTVQICKRPRLLGGQATIAAAESDATCQLSQCRPINQYSI